MATESFFSNASLAYLASAGAGKDGKAYSIKPTDGTGDFTFSRGSNLAATRVGADGLIEKGRENLLTQSNNFTSSDWDKFGSPTLTSGQSGYDGSSDAWLFTNGGGAYIYQSETTNIATYSIYAKAGNNGTGDFIYIFADAVGGRYFDLANGTLSTEILSNLIDSKIEPVSGATGWYRCSIVVPNSTRVRIYAADSSTGSSGDTTGTIYIQSAQLEIGLAATDYIESEATPVKAGLLEDEPRFDYHNPDSPTPNTCPSLLLEPSRTQLIPNSEYYNPTNTDWRSEGTNGVTITTNDTTSPEGLSNASKLQGGGASNDRLQYNFSTSNTKAIYSVFVKGTGDVVRFSIFNSRSGDRINYDVDANGNFTLNQVTGITNHDIEDYGNGWYRIWGEFTTDAALTNYFQIYSDISGSGAIYLYGVQLEDNATYPTSYIPNHSGTTGSMSTRGLDGISKDLTSVINNNQMTMFVDVKSLTSITTIIAADSFGDLRWYHQAGNRFRFYKIDDADWITNSFVVNDGDKIALTITDTQAKLFVNGEQVGTTFTLTTSFQNFSNLNYNIGSSKNEWNQLLFFSTPLSDADCITLTT